MSRTRQMDDFLVGGRFGPDPRNRPDPNAGRRPGDPYIIAQDSRPVGFEGLNKDQEQQMRNFLTLSGRGDKIANRTNIGDRQKAKLARMQFDQFRNLQRGGDYAPSLKPGMKVPGGTIQRVPQEGGLAGFLGRGGFLGNFLADLGGNAPRTIRPVDSGPSGRGRGLGSKNRLNLNTGQVKPTLSDDEIFDKLIKRATNVADANIPTGGIMNNIVAPVEEPPVSITTQPGGTIAGPAPATTFAETGMDTPFLGPIAEGTGDFSTTRTADTVDEFEKLLAESLVAQAAARSAARDTDQQLAAANTRALVADAVANQRATDAERAAALDLVNQAALEESRRQAALEGLFTEAGLENMVGDGPMLELPPGTDPIDDFDMLTLGTTPMPTGGVDFDTVPFFIGGKDTEGLRDVLGDITVPTASPAPETVLTPTSATREVTVGDERARLIGEERTRQEIENQLVSQGVDRARARMRANRAVYGFGDATPRTGMAIARGADPLAAAFEAGLPPL